MEFTQDELELIFQQVSNVPVTNPNAEAYVDLSQKIAEAYQDEVDEEDGDEE